MKMLIDILGWVGSVEVIIAYALNSYQKLKPDSYAFQLLNLTGAIFLIINTLYYRAYPSTFINIVWVGIAFSALMKMLNKR